MASAQWVAKDLYPIKPHQTPNPTRSSTVLGLGSFCLGFKAWFDEDRLKNMRE